MGELTSAGLSYPPSLLFSAQTLGGTGGFCHTQSCCHLCVLLFLLSLSPAEVLCSHNKHYSLHLTLINLEVEKWSLSHFRSCDCSLSMKNKIAPVGMESHSYLKSEKQGFQRLRHLLLWFFKRIKLLSSLLIFTKFQLCFWTLPCFCNFIELCNVTIENKNTYLRHRMF